ncbi:hypothetical protein JHK87_006490 [Glycine soja]|nr:hypothetical protein JHK87_006490 [Glycine soja]
MARAPDNIKSINGSKETLKLAVRITDLWFVGTPNKSKQAEMVIIDSHGDAIHVVCKQDQLKSWKVDLIENCTYVMHNFKVMKNDGQFRVCDRQYKLVFTGVTVVRQSDFEDLPFKKYKFVDFTNVIIGLFQPELLVDIIGVMDEVVFHHVGSKSTRVVFKLKDLRLFDLGIQVRSVLTPGGQGSSQLLGSSQLSSKDAFLSKAEAKTISEINNISEEGDVDLNVSPQALDKLLGYVLAFKVKVQPNFNNVVVLRYSNDLDLINVVVDMLLDAEACSKVHAPILDSDDPSQLEFIQYPINKKPLIMQFTALYHNDKDTIPVPSFYHQQWAPEYLDFVHFRYDGTTYQIILRQHRQKRLPNCAITHLNACGQHMTILRKFGPPLQWNVVVLDIGIDHRYVVQPWYQFLANSDFSHGDEVSFYYRRRDKIWEIIIRHKKDWDDSDTE